MSGKLEQIDQRLERIEGKLDTALERQVRTESDVGWLKGYTRLSTAVFLAIAGALGTWILSQILP